MRLTSTYLSLAILWTAPAALLAEHAAMVPVSPCAQDLIAPSPSVPLRVRLPLYLSRLGYPSYQEKRFDLRIVSHGRPEFSPRKLEDLAVPSITHYLDRYEDFGFLPVAHIHFVVEARSQSTGRFVSNDQSTHQFEAFSSQPAVRNFTQPVYIAGTHGFIEFRPNMHHGSRPLVIILPADGDGHWLNRRFATAHEIAHTNEGSNHSIWREARADFLAYMVTGISKVEKLDGEVLRNLARPQIWRMSQARLRLADFHLNSQIFSNLLFEFAIRWGIEQAFDLIHWMDYDPEPAHPLLFKGAVNHAPPTGLIEIHPDNHMAEAWQVRHNLRAIARRIRVYSQTQNQAVAEWLNEALAERQL